MMTVGEGGEGNDRGEKEKKEGDKKQKNNYLPWRESR